MLSIAFFGAPIVPRRVQEGLSSAPRNCSHEAFPFIEAAAKAKLAGRIETQPGHRLASPLDEQTLSVGRLLRRSLDEGGFSALVSSPLIGGANDWVFAKAG